MSRDNHRIWTPEDVAYLREAHADTSSAAIAERLRRPLKTVYMKANALAAGATITHRMKG